MRLKPTLVTAVSAASSSRHTYGLGVVITGNWLLQDPLFSGESAVEAYLPSQKVSIAVAVTYDPEAFDSTTGAYSNVAEQLWREIALQVAPSDPPPIPSLPSLSETPPGLSSV